MAHPVAGPIIQGDLAAPRIDGFKGIDNRSRPTVVGLERQLEAKNVLCDRAGWLVSRPGITAIRAGVADLFATRRGRLLLVDRQRRLIDGGSGATLAWDFTGAPFAWCEMETAVFALSPRGAWAIYPDRVVRWGLPQGIAPSVELVDSATGLAPGRRLIACAFQASDGRIGGTDALVSAEIARGHRAIVLRVAPLSGYRTRVYLSPPDAETLYLRAVLPEDQPDLYIGDDDVDLAAPMATLDAYPPPPGDRVGAWGARAVVACHEPERDRSTLYFSRALNPHLFDLAADFQVVAGRVTALRGLPAGLLVATDREILLIAPDGARQRLLAAGAPVSDAPPGFDREWLWTQVGPFSPAGGALPAGQSFIPPAAGSAAVALWPHQGDSYLIASLRGRDPAPPLVSRPSPAPSIIHPIQPR